MKGRIRIAMACTGLLLAAAANVRAQTANRETGSVTVGGYLVWVRGTNAKIVELFVGRGFHDAFAKAHDMDAAKLQQWIDSVRAVSPVPTDDSSAADAQLRGTALGSDVTMMRRVGGSFSGIRLLVAGEEPIKMAEPTAHEFLAMLDSAARITRELSVPPPTIMASMPMQVASPSADASPPPAPTPAPASPPAPVVATTVSTSPASQMGPSTAEAPPEVVVPAPREQLSLIGYGGNESPLPRPMIAVPAVAVAPASAPALAPASAQAPAPAPAPAPDTAAPPHADVPSDKLIRTPLGPFTIPGALLSDRDKQAQYCYTQLGLKYNPELKGEITVKLSLRSDGAVQDAVVTKRSWQGISAGEVESCVRALAHDWTFASTDPTIADGTKVLTFSFAP
jgi:hypothetical protein